MKPVNGVGGLIWASLGAKTMEIVNSNMDVGAIYEDEEILTLSAVEFLKMLLELAKEAAKAEKEVVPEEIDKGKAALTELFNGVKMLCG